MLISFAVTAKSFAVTAKLICVFVFAYAKCWFSHDVAHLFLAYKTCTIIDVLKKAPKGNANVKVITCVTDINM